MKKYLDNYIKEIDLLIQSKSITEQTISEHLVKISLFQHERLIHLLVTLVYAIMFLISLLCSLFNSICLIIALILLLFLIPYVRHYFKLENGVQYLYKQYDIMRGML